MAMYGAVTPWAALAFFGLVEESQVTEVLCTNTGIIIITILFIWKSVKKARWEYEQLLQLKRQGFRTAVFEKNCRHYRLTQREIEIVLLVQQGLTYKEVSGWLFISGKTVDNHLQHVYEKAGVNNKVELIRKLYY
jgi:DNA-binding CsgD family transcriptional regulator